MERDIRQVRQAAVDRPASRAPWRVPAAKMLAGLAIASMLWAPVGANAQGGPGHFWMGADLHAACTGRDEGDRRLCAGYVMAVVDGLAQARNDGTRTRACVPFNISRQQVLDIAIRRLEADPQSRRSFGSAVIVEALAAAYPCP